MGIDLDRSRNDFVTEDGNIDKRKKYHLKSKLKKLVKLVNEKDDVNYSIEDEDFHEWLIDQYDEYLLENYGFHKFINWLTNKYMKE